MRGIMPLSHLNIEWLGMRSICIREVLTSSTEHSPPEKVTVATVVTNCPPFVESEGSLLCSNYSVTGPYPGAAPSHYISKKDQF